MPRVKFDEIQVRRVLAGKCARCGKATRRTLVLGQTVNPFNKGNDGEPKTRAEIGAELHSEMDEKAKEPLFCSSHRT
jgi:hypothetical protein